MISGPGVTQRRSGRCGKESLSLPGIEPRLLGHPTRGLVSLLIKCP
jgi:hypothetical protein